MIKKHVSRVVAFFGSCVLLVILGVLSGKSLSIQSAVAQEVEQEGTESLLTESDDHDVEDVVEYEVLPQITELPAPEPSILTEDDDPGEPNDKGEEAEAPEVSIMTEDDDASGSIDEPAAEEGPEE